jgi:Cu+-exporting ATPase
VAAEGFTEEVLRLAASLDQGGEHPLAAIIVNAARGQNLTLSGQKNSIRVGHWRARSNVSTARTLALGNTALMAQLGTKLMR